MKPIRKIAAILILTANRFFRIEFVRPAQVDDRFGIGDFPEGRLGIDILAVSVDLQSVMALDAVAEHVPADTVFKPPLRA